jgi:hypothetical protein
MSYDVKNEIVSIGQERRRVSPELTFAGCGDRPASCTSPRQSTRPQNRKRNRNRTRLSAARSDESQGETKNPRDSSMSGQLHWNDRGKLLAVFGQPKDYRHPCNGPPLLGARALLVHVDLFQYCPNHDIFFYVEAAL